MNTKLLAVWNNPKRTSVLVGVVALNVGVGLGYILGQRRKKEVFVVDPQLAFNFDADELADIRNRKNVEHPATRPKVEKVVKNPPIAVIDKGESFIEEKIKEIVVGPVRVEISDEELVTKSVFDNPNDNWDYETEVRNRTEDAPYVLHKDEFYGEESGYTQVTLTYYAGDQILCDEDDSPVYNHELITGPLLFGHGSNDPNVVHIRNDKRKAEYEILFDPGLYSVDVLGLEIENNTRVQDLKHSQNRKFRLE